MTWRVRSTFSGVGGLDLGLERAGMKVISQCEKDDYRREVLRRHWPDVEVSDDVESVSYEEGSCELLVGGFPCQDLSVAGRRAGLAGARSGLFFEFARIADECVPEGGWILIENVPGLLSSHDGRDFGILLRTLADLGFHDLAWRVLDSRYFGVPQRRRRIFILARRSAGTRAAQVLSEPEGDGGHPQEGRKKGSKRPLAPKGGARNGGPPALVRAGEVPSARGLTRRYGKGTDSDATDTMVVAGMLGDKAHTLTSEGMDASEDGTGRGTPVIASALDRMRGGADDNDAQANHIVPVKVYQDSQYGVGEYDEAGTLRAGRIPEHQMVLQQAVGLGKDTEVSGTLGKKGVGGGGLGMDREGAFVVWDGRNHNDTGDATHTLRGLAPGDRQGSNTVVPVVAFNWQSGGDVRLGVTDDHVPTLQKEQVPALHIMVAPEVAAPLTRGHAATAGVSVPGRRKEDDANLVVYDQQNDREVEDVGALTSGGMRRQNRGFLVFGAWNMKVIEDGHSGTLLGGSKGAQYSLNNMPLVAKCLLADPGRWDYETEDFVVHVANESGTLREHVRNNSNPATEAKQHVVVRSPIREAHSVRENQRNEVDETPYFYSLAKAGGKPGQGYPAARVVQGDDVEGVVRRLTPTECERLQGFPDGWTLLEGESLAGEASWYEVSLVQSEDGSVILVPRVSDVGYLDRLVASMLGAHEVEEPPPDGRRYAAMGDAVTVPVAQWIGARLLAFGAD